MYCGVDEAGRGSVMGPLVVGAVWAENDSVLEDVGVKDSKKLTPKTRERMYSRIVDNLQWTVVIASADDIDQRRAVMSLNDVELEMFGEAVGRYRCATAYADCPDVDTERFSNRLASKVPGTEVIAKHKADDTYPIVSAASIVAKVTRDRMIADLHKEIGDFGSGYPSDHYTMEFIESWMKENGNPPPHTRNSWEPVKQLISARKVKTLDEW